MTKIIALEERIAKRLNVAIDDVRIMDGPIYPDKRGRKIRYEVRFNYGGIWEYAGYVSGNRFYIN